MVTPQGRPPADGVADLAGGPPPARGRVGRSNRRAYAYLLVPSDTELSELARKRLAALKEFSDLGAGFKIAALDLELRGAGNLLGREQHGHINAVGFDMYVRMLEEAVLELKGEEVRREVPTTLNLGLEIRIPPEYIAEEHQRLRAYKRIAEAATAEQAERIRAELEDRYGPPPEAVLHLLAYSLLKSLAQKLGIESIQRKAAFLDVKFHPSSKADPQRLMTLVRQTPGAQFSPAGLLRLPLPPAASPAAVLDTLQKMGTATIFLDPPAPWGGPLARSRAPGPATALSESFPVNATWRGLPAGQLHLSRPRDVLNDRGGTGSSSLGESLHPPNRFREPERGLPLPVSVIADVLWLDLALSIDD